MGDMIADMEAETGVGRSEEEEEDKGSVQESAEEESSSNVSDDVKVTAQHMCVLDIPCVDAKSVGQLQERCESHVNAFWFFLRCDLFLASFIGTHSQLVGKLCTAINHRAFELQHHL